MTEGKWTVNTAIKKAEEYTKDLDIPKIKVDITEREDVTFKNLAECDNEELQEYLSLSGAWLAYIDLQLSDLRSKRGAYETAYEAGLKIAKSKIATQYSEQGKKKPTIDELEGEILAGNDNLNNIKKTLIEVQAAYDLLEGRKEAYKGLWVTASRIVALRTMGGN